MRRMTALLTAASALSIGAALAPGIAHASVVGHIRVAINSDAGFPNYGWTAGHEQVVVLQPWDVSKLYALKSANPRVTVLMYKNASSVSTSSASDGRYATGVSYAQAAANGWFLRNAGGSPIQFSGYSWLYASDIGSGSYQRAWLSGVLRDLGSDPWDGVLIDDVNPTIKYHYCVSCVAKYPSDERYAGAMQSFVEHVGPRLRAAGKLAIANIGSWAGYNSVVDPWLKSLSGAEDEMFLKWGAQRGTGYADPATWAIQLHECKLAQSEGKLFIGITHSSNDDARAAVYGYATELLASNGKGIFSMLGDYSTEPWFAAYDYHLGAPAGPEWVTSSGVHERRFAAGLVLVNPTLSRQTAALGGAYSGSGLNVVRSASLAPQSGLILLGPARASRRNRALRHAARHRLRHRHHRHRLTRAHRVSRS
jgi:hypothetical protein